MINKAILVGRLGRDPEIKYTPNGVAIVNFSMATDEVWKKDGQKQSKTEWHRIVVFDKLAEICSQYLSKGKLIYIEGKIQTREWTDKEGGKRYTTEIVANEMKMLDSKDSGSGSRAFHEDPGPSDSDIPPSAFRSRDIAPPDMPKTSSEPGNPGHLDDIPF
jgi:single-strand DNA-binding protein